MANNLDITKPVVGGSRDTWGALLNTIIDLFNKAFGDTEIITDNTGTVVLTKAQTANYALRCTGTGGGGVTLHVPDNIGRGWVVENDRGSGAITVRCAAGGTSVTVGLGLRALVRSDGTNCRVIDQGAYIPGGTDVPIADGGTGQSTVIAAHDALNTHGAQIVSATTLDLDAATGSFVEITGTTTITAVTLAEGKQRFARAAGAFQITAGASLRVNGSTSVAYLMNGGEYLIFEGFAAGLVGVTVVNSKLIYNSIFPSANDGAALGAGTFSFSDLFLASGGVINFANGDVTITHSPNLLAFGAASSGYTFDAAVLPSANDSAALGSATVSWADLFLASGAVVNIANGNWVATHSTGVWTVGTGDIRITTAGTNSASVVTVGGTQTLTSKTLTSPVLNTATVGTSLLPTTNDGAALGASGTAWSDAFFATGAVLNFAAGAYTVTHSPGVLDFVGYVQSDGFTFSTLQIIVPCTGSPEGAITATVGAMALRTDGSTSTTLYIKTSGVGNTGWTAK